MPDNAPLIGITADIGGHPDEQDERAYLVRCNYVDAIERAGGLAVVLPYPAGGMADDYVARLDGLLVTGGRFDLPPAWHSGAAASGAILKEERSLAERALVEAALARDLPVLGVCNGMQLLGVLHGAAMIGHIPADVDGALEHMAAETPHEVQHEVAFVPGTMLAAVVRAASARVNSVHHQALRTAANVRAAATASDGVIEAIELPGHRFCVGVQWHPEYGLDDADLAIMKAFVAAAGEQRAERA